MSDFLLSLNVSNSTSHHCFPYYFFTVTIHIWFTLFLSLSGQTVLYALYISWQSSTGFSDEKSIFTLWNESMQQTTVKSNWNYENNWGVVWFLPRVKKLAFRLRIHYRWDMLEKCKDTLIWSLYIVIVNFLIAAKQHQLMYIVFFIFHFHWNMFSLLIILPLFSGLQMY